MRLNLKITALLGIITVVLGAFGAHALKDSLSVDALKSFETAVRYQMYHVIVLLFVNGYHGFASRVKNRISYLFFAGILLFSGSIYAISFGVSATSIWFLTPLGGLLLIMAWSLMLISFIKETKN